MKVFIDWLKKYWIYIVIVIVILAFVFPIIIYIGFMNKLPLAQTAEDMSFFGGYLSGVYTPLVGLLTLAVLYFQVTSQNRTAQKQIEIASKQNKIVSLQNDIALFSREIEFVDYYIEILKENLNYDVNPFVNMMRSTFIYYLKLHLQFLRDDQSLPAYTWSRFKDNDYDFYLLMHRENYKVLTIWESIREVLERIKNSESNYIKYNFNNVQNRISGNLGYEECMLLDRFYMSMKNSSKVYYEFISD